MLQVILCTHAGRPKGEVVESMRIGNIGGCLGELLDESVACPTDCIGEKVEEQVRRMSPACAARSLTYPHISRGRRSPNVCKSERYYICAQT